MRSSDSQTFIVKDGDFNQPLAHLDYLQETYVSTDPAMEVEIRPYKEKRSTLQNNWYFEILSQICEATGFNKEALHIWMKKEFLGLDPQTIWDQQINVTKSTTKLTVKQMSEYISQVERFCAEKGIELIYPNYWGEVHK